MNTLLKYAGVILLLLGVLCLVIYYAACPQNSLLIAALALEVIGVVTFILVNKYIK